VTPITEDELAARGAAIVRSVRVEPPLDLRERIEAQRAHSVARGRRLRWRFAGAIAAGAAALVVALAVVGDGSDPSVDEAAALSSQAPTGPAPALDRSTPQLLAVSHEGLPYPNWTPKFAWRHTGQRGDSVDGRAAHTVYYTNKKGARIGYTIVSGDALSVPADATTSTVEGTVIRDYVSDGRRIVTWERDGRTCVLAGPASVDRQVMLDLAGWKGKGAVRF
jgi:hypothetical protein